MRRMWRQMLWAHTEPAGGAPLDDVVAASIVGVLFVLGLAGVALLYVRGGARPLRWAAAAATEATGLPRWAALPSVLTMASLVTAVFGFYWDVSTHIDNGRDAGPFANPAHYFIFIGLVGIATAGFLSLLLSDRFEGPSGVRIGERVFPVSGIALFVCGAIALAGFPLDDVWHRLFGQDVTLWGPTHIQMIGGASLATFAVWMMHKESAPEKRSARLPASLLPAREALIAGAFLTGLSTLQAEFDFGVPQFRLLYHPVLIMLGASIGLVAARMKLGRGGALKAALVFIVLRGLLSLAVGPVLGRITLHFPLYLVEALVVEAVALRRNTSSPTFGLMAGAGIGTIGLAAEWAWSHLWMPIPWPAGLSSEAVPLGVAAGLAGGVIGAWIGRGLAGTREAFSPRVAFGAAAVAVVCLAYPAPMDLGAPVSARVELEKTDASTNAFVIAHLTPPDAAEDALWFHALAWQGLDWERGASPVVPMEEIGSGTFRSVEPVPVGGSWKSLLRLHRDNSLLALPLYLPEDPAIPAREVPARDGVERSFVVDKKIVQREAITSNIWLQRFAYSVLVAIGVLWIATLAWALARLSDRMRDLSPRRAAGRSEATVV
jgi:hypothetical protein